MSASTIVLSALIGLTTGVLASLASWWLLFRRLAPRLDLEETLNHYTLKEGETPRSQVRLRVGSRPIVDLRVTLALSVPDLVNDGSTESVLLYRREADFMGAGKTPRYRIRVDMMSEDTVQRFRRYLGPRLAEHIEQRRPMDLKVLFEEHPGTELRVTAIARDAVTGATGVTRRLYGSESLHEGHDWDADA